MRTLVDFVLPVLFVIAVWWSSTGAIFYLNGRGEENHRWNLLGAAALALLAVCVLLLTRRDPGPAEAATAFVAAVAIWGLIEMSFLTGYVTGSNREPCPLDCSGLQRFGYACLAIAYHEAAIISGIGLIYWITSGSANFVGVGTFALLWIMRLSTKLNIFFGVPNTAEEMLPNRIAYLKSYFRKGPMSGFFPLSVTAVTCLPLAFAMRAGADSANAFEVTGYSLLAALAALGVIEHWLLVLPIRAETLWGWSLSSGGSAVPMSDRLSGETLLHKNMSAVGRSTDI